MTYLDVERIKQIADRYCGPDILVKEQTFDLPVYVVQRRAAKEWEENTEVVRIPGNWVRDQEWGRIEEAIRNACK